MPSIRASRVAGRRERGGLENEVLAALATSSAPSTPADVLADLGGDLAYTTVMTTLARLHDKGLVSRRKAGRAYAYALVDDATVTARQMRRVLDASDSREGVLARFLDELDPADVPVLQRLLDESPGA